jgi:hypothetical protein
MKKEKATMSARDRLQARMQGGGFDTGGGLGSDAFVKFADGVNFLRVLPRVNKAKGGRIDPDKDIFFIERRRHFGAGPNNRSIICPKTKSDRAECAVCDRVASLRNSDGKKEANQLAARNRYLMNGVLLTKDGKLASSEAKIVDIGKTILKEIVQYYNDTVEFGDPWGKDLGKKGVAYDFKITKSGTGLKTDYAVQPTQRFKGTANSSKLLGSLYDLEEEFPIPTSEEAEAQFTGDEEEDEDEGKKKPTKSKAKPAPADVDDEDEDDEDDEDEDDDEDDKDDDEDDEDDKDDDEDDEDDDEDDEDDDEDDEDDDDDDDKEV